MADKRITELTATTTIADTDLFAVAYNVASTAETRKIAKSDLFTTLQIQLQNNLINGGFDFVQRQDPTTLTTITTDKYSADRWRISVENAGLQYGRDNGNVATIYSGKFVKTTNTGKCMIYQILEGRDSYALRGKTVTFSVAIAVNSNITVRLGIIELNSSGTVDTIPATFVSAWGANTVDPTLGTNLAYVGTPVSKAVTGAWSTGSVTVTLPSNSKNFIVAVWTDSQIVSTQTLSLTEAGLYAGSVAPVWSSRSVQQELALCQRYYQKSYDIDIAPATASSVGGLKVFTVITPSANLNYYGCVIYPVILRTGATPTIYGYAGGSGKVSIGAADQGASSGSVTFVGLSGFTPYNNSGGALAAGSQINFHYIVDAEL